MLIITLIRYIISSGHWYTLSTKASGCCRHAVSMNMLLDIPREQDHELIRKQNVTVNVSTSKEIILAENLKNDEDKVQTNFQC